MHMKWGKKIGSARQIRRERQAGMREEKQIVKTLTLVLTKPEVNVSSVAMCFLQFCTILPALVSVNDFFVLFCFASSSFHPWVTSSSSMTFLFVHGFGKYPFLLSFNCLQSYFRQLVWPLVGHLFHWLYCWPLISWPLSPPFFWAFYLTMLANIVEKRRRLVIRFHYDIIVLN